MNGVTSGIRLKSGSPGKSYTLPNFPVADSHDTTYNLNNDVALVRAVTVRAMIELQVVISVVPSTNLLIANGTPRMSSGRSVRYVSKNRCF